MVDVERCSVRMIAPSTSSGDGCSHQETRKFAVIPLGEPGFVGVDKDNAV